MHRIEVRVGGKSVGTVEGMAIVGTRIMLSGVSVELEGFLMDTREVDMHLYDQETGRGIRAIHAFPVRINSSGSSTAVLETNRIEEEADTAA
jgi:hypothetical protein